MQLSEIPASRKQLAITASEVLSMRSKILERTVILLERTKHGALARATKARAEHLAVVAEATEGKLKYALKMFVYCKAILLIFLP